MNESKKKQLIELLKKYDVQANQIKKLLKEFNETRIELQKFSTELIKEKKND